FRFVIGDVRIRSIFIVMVLFTLGASFIYVLAAPFAKLTLEAGPRAYGLILGAMGLGAVAGAMLLKRLRARMPPSALLATLMLLYGAAAIALSQTRNVPLAIGICFVAGVGWTGSFSSLAALMQIWTENRLRARSIALYTMTHLGMWGVGATL